VAVNVCDVSSPSRYYAIRGQVDFPQVKFDEEWDNATRFWFGVVFGFGK